jgi:hypothetical protein
MQPMVAIRIGNVSLTSLDDDAFGTVLEAAVLAGGQTRFPMLFGLPRSDTETEPMSLLDELARLANTAHGRGVAMLIGSLRDDLMTAVAAADEG